MKLIKKLIWSIRNRNAIKVVKTLFASIRREEEDRKLSEEYELVLQILDLSEIFDCENGDNNENLERFKNTGLNSKKTRFGETNTSASE